MGADGPLAGHRFGWGLGMALVAKSDQSTKNSTFASYVLQSGELVFTLTAPYSRCVRLPGTAAGMLAQGTRLRSRAVVSKDRKPMGPSD